VSLGCKSSIIRHMTVHKMRVVIDYNPSYTTQQVVQIDVPEGLEVIHSPLLLNGYTIVGSSSEGGHLVLHLEKMVRTHEDDIDLEASHHPR